MYEGHIIFLTEKPKRRVYAKVSFPEFSESQDAGITARAYMVIIQEAFIEVKHKYRHKRKMKPLMHTAQLYWVNEDKVPCVVETAIQWLVDAEKKDH